MRALRAPTSGRQLRYRVDRARGLAELGHGALNDGLAHVQHVLVIATGAIPVLVALRPITLELLAVVDRVLVTKTRAWAIGAVWLGVRLKKDP